MGSSSENGLSYVSKMALSISLLINYFAFSPSFSFSFFVMQIKTSTLTLSDSHSVKKSRKSINSDKTDFSEYKYF